MSKEKEERVLGVLDDLLVGIVNNNFDMYDLLVGKRFLSRKTKREFSRLCNEQGELIMRCFDELSKR